MRFIFRRMIELAVVMFGLSVLIFVISRVLPGDPVRFALGPQATEEQIAQLSREMGLDQPLVVQYWRLIKGLFQGDLGVSLTTFRPIAGDLATFLPASLELALFSMSLAILVGVPLGVMTAVHRNSSRDYIGRAVAFSGVAIPVFWFALLVQALLSFQWRIFPPLGRIDADVRPPPHVTGSFLIDSLLVFDIGLFFHVLSFLILPAVVLAASPMAMILRLLRASMIDEMGKDYVLTARANGMPRNLLIHKYVLRNAFSATLTIIGLLFGFFIGGAFIVETVFSWPGIGRYGVRALQFKDFNAIIAVTLLVGLAYAAANTVVAVLYGWLDPRLRLGRR
ncbi:MAG: ABC transporter permease [Proteobacteria bacterium]|nr:ABC transporter permease [Pseudomonadota bacterium]MDA1057725.1 ABC transporter permease [Pseudomonadota bacterium]